MMRVEVSSKMTKYDNRHDVLHVFLGNCLSGDVSAEEEYPGVYIKRCDDTDDVVGITILDYSKKKSRLSSILPDYEFASV